MGIKIRDKDLETLIDICDQVLYYKRVALTRRALDEFEQTWLPKLIKQMSENDFTWNDPTKNTAVWLIDQICHSHRLVPGCKPRDGVCLADTELGQRAIEILRAMSRGQGNYNSWVKDQLHRELFR